MLKAKQTKTAKPSAANANTTTQAANWFPPAKEPEPSQALAFDPVTGEAIIPKLADLDPMPYGWGAVAGASLMLEAIPVITHNAKDGFLGAEFIIELLKEAFAIEAEAVDLLNGRGRKEAARQVIFHIADMAAGFIATGKARAPVEASRRFLLEQVEEDEHQERLRLKAKAMLARKGGGYEL